MCATSTNEVIFHSRPTLGDEEIERVRMVMNSGHLTQGGMVLRFERAMASYIGAKGAVACNSGTSALHLALLGMEIGPGDEVIIPTYVCTALLNAVRYVNAAPVLADIDPNTLNLDPEDIKRKLRPQTRAIIVPHLFGMAADIEPLLKLGVPIIEDCAHAVGATYHKQKIGSFGHAAIFSFYATKMMTSGEGGMVLSNCAELLEKIRDIRQYDNRADTRLRYNYKLMDIQAAIGLTQLEKLPDFIERRRSIAKDYNSGFKNMPAKLPPDDPGSVYYRYILQTGKKNIPEVIEQLGKHGIECARPVFEPLHRLLNINGFPQSEQAWSQSLSIPIYPSLTTRQTRRVIAAVTEVLGEVGA